MSYIGNQPKYQAFVTDVFSGDNGTTQFTLSVAPPSATAILVAIAGVLQNPSTYGVNGTTLTFTQAPPLGTNNISVRHLGLTASNAVTTAYRTVTEATASDGQTTFAPGSYTPGYVDVFRNGVKLGAADYTATNGTSVVLANPCNANDLITVVSFYISAVNDAIPNQAGAVTAPYLDVGGKSGAGAMILPSGTTLQRPTPVNGMIRYNSQTGYSEVYQQSNWNSIGITFNGTSPTTAFRSSADITNQAASGVYYIKTANMASAQQYFVDYSTAGGPWVRIFLASTDNYNQTSFSWDNSETPNLLANCQYFMYGFCNTANNALTYPWAFRFNDSTTLAGSADANKTAFFNGPPMGHGSAGAPLITLVYTIRLADSSTYTGYLRTGSSSFGSLCDDGRSGTWGQICLKAGGTGGSGVGSGGYSDFPHYTTFANAGTDNWAASNQNYTSGTVSSTYRFAVYCKLV